MNLFLAIPLFISGPILAIIGYVFKKSPPPEINRWVGYRTASSRRNADTWATANAYAANLMLLGGGVFILLGLISLVLPNMGITGVYIGQGLIIGFLIIIIVATEMHLNKTFDKNGNRRV